MDVTDLGDESSEAEQGSVHSRIGVGKDVVAVPLEHAEDQHGPGGQNRGPQSAHSHRELEQKDENHDRRQRPRDIQRVQVNAERAVEHGVEAGSERTG